MPISDKVVTFRPDSDTFDAMALLRERDGVPFSEQIRRALRAWLEAKGVMTSGVPRSTKRSKEKTSNRNRSSGERT